MRQTENPHQNRQQWYAKQVLNSLMEAVAVTDSNLRFLYINPAFTKVTNYTWEDVFSGTFEGWTQVMKDAAHLAPSLNMAEGQWDGEVWLNRKGSGPVPVRLRARQIETTRGTAPQFIWTFQDITDHKNMEHNLHVRMERDPLTGLLNRSTFQRQLEHAAAKLANGTRSVGLLFLDIDRFKNINDSLGYQAGDEIMHLLARRLMLCQGPDDLIARMGGDEFALFLEREHEEALWSAIQHVLSVLKEPVHVQQQELFVTTSAGVTVCTPEHRDVTAWIELTDAAMYQAKDLGGDTCVVSGQDAHRVARDRMQLETKLRKALMNAEFVLYYQPQVSIASGKITGFEVLLRWMNPELGMVLPSAFIPLAEETGMIVAIGEWVLRTACCQLKTWLDRGLGPLRVAVNLSARQFQQDNLVDMVKAILTEVQLPAEYLELEITESAAMYNVQPALKTLQALRNLGVRISIDDFGTGYSSLSYLKKFPIQTLKIDQSFVRDIPGDSDGASIAKSVIMLAHGLKLNVIAEGVEWPEQFVFLKEHQCNECQGYYFGHPMPAHEAHRLLETQALSHFILPAGPH